MITCIYDNILNKKVHKLYDINAWNCMLSIDNLIYDPTKEI